MKKHECPADCKECKNKSYCFEKGNGNKLCLVCNGNKTLAGKGVCYECDEQSVTDFEHSCHDEAEVKNECLKIAIERIRYFLSNYQKIEDGNDLRGWEQSASMAVDYIEARLERGKFKDLDNIF